MGFFSKEIKVIKGAIPEIGDRAKDKITGYQGIVIGINDHAFGCKHIYLKKEGLNKEKKPDECESFDIQRIDVLAKKAVPYTPRITHIKLGDEVKDQITGFKGITTAICHWQSGEIAISVQSQELYEGKPIGNQAFNDNQLIVIKAAKIEVPKQVELRTKENPHPGGPGDVVKIIR